MGLLRPSRERRGPDPYLRWKELCFIVGAAVGLVGILTRLDWLIIPAVIILAAGIGLRFLNKRSHP